MEELSRYPLIKKIEENNLDIYNNIKYAYISIGGYTGLIYTKKQCLYYINCGSFHDDDTIYKQIRVDVDNDDGDENSIFEKRKIIDITGWSEPTSEDDQFALLMDTGEVFVIDQCKSTDPNKSIKPYLLLFEGSPKIKQIASGSEHTLALCEKGNVFCWGGNSHLQCFSSEQRNTKLTKPRIHSMRESAVVTYIACGAYHSVAVTTLNQIICWGKNSNGQCGLWSSIPITGISTPIKKIVSGASFNIAMTEDGKMYGWGRNHEGQLGVQLNNNKKYSEIPIEIKSLANIVDVEIYVSYWSDVEALCAALSATGDIYIWGQCGESIILTPTLTGFSSMISIFVNYFCTWSRRPHTTRMQKVAGEFGDLTLEKPTLSATFSKLFDNENFSDVKLIVDKNIIYAHKLILTARCDYFKNMLNIGRCVWKESQNNEILITKYSYETYRAFLLYLYTGELSISIDTAIDMIDLAQEYMELALKLKLERLLRIEINIENVAMMYALSNKYNLIELYTSSVQFTSLNIPAVILSESYRLINSSVARKLITEAARKKTVIAK